jgi:hypothetical protein
MHVRIEKLTTQLGSPAFSMMTARFRPWAIARSLGKEAPAIVGPNRIIESGVPILTEKKPTIFPKKEGRKGDIQLFSCLIRQNCAN